MRQLTDHSSSSRGVMLRLLFFSGLTVGLLFAPGQITPTLSDDSSGPTAVIKATDQLTFTPSTLEIESGQTVVWRNDSVLVHTVTADPEKATMPKSVKLPDGAKPFASGKLAPQEAFSHRFSVPGIYTYFCVPHEGAGMRGTVIVH